MPDEWFLVAILANSAEREADSTDFLSKHRLRFRGMKRV